VILILFIAVAEGCPPHSSIKLRHCAQNYTAAGVSMTWNLKRLSLNSLSPWHSWWLDVAFALWVWTSLFPLTLSLSPKLRPDQRSWYVLVLSSTLLLFYLFTVFWRTRRNSAQYNIIRRDFFLSDETWHRPGWPAIRIMMSCFWPCKHTVCKNSDRATSEEILTLHHQ